MVLVSYHFAHLVIDVEDALLDLVVDLPRGVDEGLLDVGRRLGRRLHEDEAVLARERLPLFPLDVAARLQITWEEREGKIVTSFRTPSGSKIPTTENA